VAVHEAEGRGRREEGNVTLAEILAGIIVISLNAYVLLAGADKTLEGR